MANQLKAAVIDWIPPVIFRHWVRWRTRESISDWEVVPEGFAAAHSRPEIKGWNVASVVETYKAKWPAYLRSLEGTDPLGSSHEGSLTSRTDLIEHNLHMSYAYVLALASRELSRFSMLDWGGGIGHYYPLSRVMVPGLEIEYHCKDVPLLAEHGRRLFPEATFWTDDSCLERQYDLVFASGSFHYSEAWKAALAGLAQATSGYLFITQLPVVERAPAFVYVQRPYSFGYDTEYLSWCLNRVEFLSAAKDTNLALQREFIVGHQPPIRGAPEQCEYRGFLFRPLPSGAEA